jgi:cytochrome c oxidase subunit I
MVIGTNLTFAPMFWLGQWGMPRRIARYPQHPGWQTLNLLETIGAGIIALGILVFLVNVWVSLRRREVAGDDPWGAQSLEWWTTSPPPRHNFPRGLPPIRSYAPLLDLRHEMEDRGAQPEQEEART